MRLLQIKDSPLSTDALVLTRVSGQEAISELFEYDLELLYKIDTVEPSEVLGQSLTFSIGSDEENRRYINGMIAGFRSLHRARENHFVYQVWLVPSFWATTLRSNSRIFQDCSPKDIIEEVLKDHPDVTFDAGQIKNATSKREYAVQYRESDFAFLSRLMEEEGIYYLIVYDENAGGRFRHKIIFGDDTTAYLDCPDSPVIYSSDTMKLTHIEGWKKSWQTRTGEWLQSDYNFEKPSLNLETSAKNRFDWPKGNSTSRYDYPGRYIERKLGDRLTKLRIEEEETSAEVSGGRGQYISFAPGSKFKIKEGKDIGVPDSSVLTRVVHRARDTSALSVSNVELDYENEFSCIEATVVYRPPRHTPKGMIRGPQTAIVVGPSGEKSHPDKYGRVKVQFPWDREGKNDEKSTCWLRVAQTWAGPNYGAQFIPKIGMEVLVDFLEGDPDRPLVVGCLYNGDNSPPFPLPAEKTQSGIRTMWTDKQNKRNELRFDDKEGKEEIFIHAGKNFKRIVKNNDRLRVGNKQTRTIHQERVTTIEEGDDTLTLEKGNLAINVDKGTMATVVGLGDMSTEVTVGSIAVEAGTAIELKVGGSSIFIDGTCIKLEALNIEIKGTVSVKVEALQVGVKGSASTKVEGAMVNIEAGGIAILKGALVKIN